MNDWFQIAGGGLLLYVGAEWFVGGASGIALALRIPQILVGLTVVAYGTSAPEIIVGVRAAMAGHGALALGNVFGSNIANIGLILGVAALVRPARVNGALRRRELPVLLVSTASVPLLLMDGSISLWEAGGLLLAATAYTGWMVYAARTSAEEHATRRDAINAGQAADVAGAPRSRGHWRPLLTACGGLGVLLIGGELFVQSAVRIAHSLGMSERLVGLTIVAIGTSLPELVTSVIAARRGHSDLAVGNVVGSNIFNIFLCLGLSRLGGVIAVPLESIRFDVAALLVMTGVAATFIRTERTITRVEGGVSLALFAAFMGATIARG